MTREHKIRAARFWLIAFAVAIIGMLDPTLWFGIVPLFFSGCTPCCEPPCTVTCNLCQSNLAACEYELTIAGVGGSCDGTFLIANLGIACEWGPGAGSCGGGVWPIMNISTIGTDRRYAVRTGTPTTLFFQSYPGLNGSDCLSINVSVNPTASAPPGATCQIVAVT